MFAKDSVLDLASLAKSKSSSSEDSVSLNEGESSVVAVAFSEDSKKDVVGAEQDTAATSAATSEVASAASDGLSNGDSGPSKAPSYGTYSGFSPGYYADYENEAMTYDMDPYAPTIFGKKGGDGNNFLCCLFAPWWSKKQIEDNDSEYQNEDAGNERRSLGRATSHDEDEVSTGSEAYGEKLTDKDRLAVLARLRLPQPEPSLASESSPAPHGKGLLNEIQSCGPEGSSQKTGELANIEKPKDKRGDGRPGKPKGILKRKGSSFNEQVAKSPSKTPATSASEHSTRRRSLFPTLDSTSTAQSPRHHVRFSPMARVVTVKSRNDMTFMEKTWTWWQKSDYDAFKKAGRIIAKAILEGGSEVWLTSKSQVPSDPRSRSFSATSKPRSFHLSDRDSDIRSHEPVNQLSSDEYGDKWWCSFGHSRRGLEHIASMEEGRQRQTNVRYAARAVLCEQRKQQMQSKVDPEKLRSVSLRHTSWARDLALAAGSADAEAVETEFSKGAKSREFYLLKQAKANAGTGRQVPSFMMPSGVTPLVLDVNTSSQIRMRRAKVAPEPSTSQKPKKEPQRKETMEAIHDPVDTRDNISKKAAGFGTETDMAAVLSGMGAVAPQRTSVGAH